MILRRIMSFHDSKVHLRTASPHWRQLIEARFPPHTKYDPPYRGQGFVVVEEDLEMNKIIYSATLKFASSDGSLRSGSFESSTGTSDSVSRFGTGETSPKQRLRTSVEEHAAQTNGSKVSFTNWVPSYYRSNANDCREVVHEMDEADAIATWILITKLLNKHESDIATSGSRVMPEDERSETVSRGGSCIACSGRGWGCRVCNQTGVREFTSMSPRDDARTATGSVGCGFLWVRCGGDLDVSCCSNQSTANQWVLTKKHPLLLQDLIAIQSLLDHRRNPRLRRKDQVPAQFVPFGGVSNV